MATDLGKSAVQDAGDAGLAARRAAMRLLVEAGTNELAQLLAGVGELPGP